MHSTQVPRLTFQSIQPRDSHPNFDDFFDRINKNLQTTKHSNANTQSILAPRSSFAENSQSVRIPIRQRETWKNVESSHFESVAMTKGESKKLQNSVKKRDDQAKYSYVPIENKINKRIFERAQSSQKQQKIQKFNSHLNYNLKQIVGQNKNIVSELIVRSSKVAQREKAMKVPSYETYQTYQVPVKEIQQKNFSYHPYVFHSLNRKSEVTREDELIEDNITRPAYQKLFKDKNELYREIAPDSDPIFQKTSWNQCYWVIPGFIGLLALVAGIIFGLGLFDLESFSFNIRKWQLQPKIPAITTPNITIPIVPVSNITTPNITIPDITIPVIPTPNITIPNITIPEIPKPNITVPNITIPDINIPSIKPNQTILPNITIPVIPTEPVISKNITTPEIVPQLNQSVDFFPQLIPPITLPIVPITQPEIPFEPEPIEDISIPAEAIEVQPSEVFVPAQPIDQAQESIQPQTVQQFTFYPQPVPQLIISTKIEENFVQPALTQEVIAPITEQPFIDPEVIPAQIFVSPVQDLSIQPNTLPEMFQPEITQQGQTAIEPQKISTETAIEPQKTSEITPTTIPQKFEPQTSEPITITPPTQQITQPSQVQPIQSSTQTIQILQLPYNVAFETLIVRQNILGNPYAFQTSFETKDYVNPEKIPQKLGSQVEDFVEPVKVPMTTITSPINVPA